ncbi:hypothetical protein DIE18_36515 [Burkholderia sp. Bp9125]|nr:hypothetical protein DIE18_36515 [Burkholderia sp. Bp9125]
MKNHARWAALYRNQNRCPKTGPGTPLILAMAVTIGATARASPRAPRRTGGVRARYNRTF